MVFHDPFSPCCRSPVGAAVTDSCVTLRLDADADTAGASLVLFSGDGCQSFDMLKEQGCFVRTLKTPSEPQVLWYFFKVRNGGSVFYYGRHGAAAAAPEAFQLTVYKDGFTVPSWLQNGIMYQIFPDRFAKGDENTVKTGLMYHRSMGRSFFLHGDFSEKVQWQPRGGQEHYTPDDVFGGTLSAIEQRLPYLKSLGVSVIYLNPIFESASNHRYDTADYSRVDPLLGTNRDFSSLAASAEKMGIRILLDGVFSHTGADSLYFDRFGRYQSPGACQSTDSPFFGWYEFYDYPDSYRCWWGFDSLPEVNEKDAGWQEYMLTSPNAVLPTWIKRGCSGYRLDVADEIPDEVLEKMRLCVKSADADSVLLGEVWEDATTKESFGVRRRYALGTSLDSVMNYPLRKNLIDFALKKQTAFALADFLLQQRFNYPLPMYYGLMNLLSSHDVPRIRTVLSSGLEGQGLTREMQASFVLTSQQESHGTEKHRMCAFIQYVLPGIPALYYGDEEGMQGFCDPFNRAPMHKGQYPLTEWYAQLGQKRGSISALRCGCIAVGAAGADVLYILRFIYDGSDVFSLPAENGFYLAVVNRSDSAVRTVIDLYRDGRGLTHAQMQGLKDAALKTARCLFTSKTAEVNSGLVDLTLQSRGLYLFKLS